MKRARRMLLTLAAAAAVSSPALASFHLMVIEEVFPGTPANPDAQYVMLRMTSRAQTIVSNTVIDVQDSAGTFLGRFGSFTANAGTAGAVGCVYPNCPAIIIGTMAAQTLLGMTFDQVVDGQAGRIPLPMAGGRVCFRSTTSPGSVVDCVAFSSFTAPNTVSTPTQSGCDADFGLPAAALESGFSLDRGAFSCAAKENATDFQRRFPRPVANNGTSATADADGDGLIDRLDCDDADTSSLYPVLEVTPLDASPATLSWPGQSALAGSSTTYDVAAGDVADLRASDGFAGSVCLARDLGSAAVPMPADPPVGSGVWLLVRSRNGCGTATWGESGQVPDPRDFLDDAATDPCL